MNFYELFSGYFFFLHVIFFLFIFFLMVKYCLPFIFFLTKSQNYSTIYILNLGRKIFKDTKKYINFVLSFDNCFKLLKKFSFFFLLFFIFFLFLALMKQGNFNWRIFLFLIYFCFLYIYGIYIINKKNITKYYYYFFFFNSINLLIVLFCGLIFLINFFISYNLIFVGLVLISFKIGTLLFDLLLHQKVDNNMYLPFLFFLLSFNPLIFFSIAEKRIDGLNNLSTSSTFMVGCSCMLIGVADGYFLFGSKKDVVGHHTKQTSCKECQEIDGLRYQRQVFQKNEMESDSLNRTLKAQVEQSNERVKKISDQFEEFQKKSLPVNEQIANKKLATTFESKIDQAKIFFKNDIDPYIVKNTNEENRLVLTILYQKIKHLLDLFNF